MGVSFGSSGRASFVSEINVTPFVDVMLVLLIIFMITAPMLTQGLEVDLPQTRTVSVLPREVEHLVLTIKKDGQLFLDKYPIDMDELPEQVKKLVTDQKKQLFLKADKEVPYGIVVQTMGQVKAGGIDKLGVVAESEPEDNNAGKKPR